MTEQNSSARVREASEVAALTLSIIRTTFGQMNQAPPDLTSGPERDAA